MTISAYMLVPGILFVGLIVVTTFLGGIGCDILALRRANSK